MVVNNIVLQVTFGLRTAGHLRSVLQHGKQQEEAGLLPDLLPALLLVQALLPPLRGREEVPPGDDQLVP